MFIATNFEEEDDTLEAEVNDDDKLCRFEFYEIIVRLAFGKYIRSGLMTDASDSVGALVDNIIAPNLPPLAKVDPDDFRCGLTVVQHLSLTTCAA